MIICLSVNAYHSLMIVLEHQTLFIVQSALDNTLDLVYSSQICGHIEILREFRTSDSELFTCAVATIGF